MLRRGERYHVAVGVKLELRQPLPEIGVLGAELGGTMGINYALVDVLRDLQEVGHGREGGGVVRVGLDEVGEQGLGFGEAAGLDERAGVGEAGCAGRKSIHCLFEEFQGATQVALFHLDPGAGGGIGGVVRAAGGENRNGKASGVHCDGGEGGHGADDG